MVPLIINDIVGGSGRFNLSLGFVGFAIGVGATLSTAAGGWTADLWGDSHAFLLLALVGLAALLLVILVMPETRQSGKAPPR
jgi:predicted MFS family arabinose efflux permease